MKRYFKKIKFELLSFVIDQFYRNFTATYRYRFTGIEHIEAAQEKHPLGNFVLATWHQGFFASVNAMRQNKLTCLISPSKDGEVIARVAEKLGYTVIRGSSSRGGSEARDAFYHSINSIRCCPTLTPDGPRGPRFVVKSGAVDFARKGGLSIVPFAADSPKRWLLHKSWDRGLIPKPFQRVRIEFGEPMAVSTECHGEDFLQAKLGLAKRLNDVAVRLAIEFGHGASCPSRDPAPQPQTAPKSR